MSALTAVTQKSVCKFCSRSAFNTIRSNFRAIQTSSRLPCSTTTEADHEDQASQSSQSREEDVREQIFQAALGHVHEHGWTKKAIAAGAEEVGLPGVAHGMFPNGGIDLIHHLYVTCNDDLTQYMEEKRQMLHDQGEKLRIAPFIRDAVETRLRMNTPYLETWPQAMAIMALPQNAPQSWKNLADLVDEIWYQAGDRSVDMNWYTKRLSLAAAYKSTELHLLQDKSEDYQETWHFLDRRMDNLAAVGNTIRQTQQFSSSLITNIWSSCTLARNMLGVNDRNR